MKIFQGKDDFPHREFD